MSAATATVSTPLRFDPPGPGSWMLDVTHHGRWPVTAFLRPYYDEAFVEGMPVLLERYGLPIARFKIGYVHGCQYMRPMSVGEPETPKGDPPRPLLWLLSRLHPELRRRNKAAARAWAERLWRADVDNWFERGGREAAIAGNRAIQDVDVAALDDAALLNHLDEAVGNFRALARRGFETHGGDLIPTGDLFAHCPKWGIDVGAAAALLAGASPASIETARVLAPAARAIAHAPSRPTSVEEVRALSPEADAAVSEWLADHGWRLLFSDDLDSPTLAESPDLVLRALLAAGEPPTPAADPGPVRAQVPQQYRDEFDALLTEARYGLRLRDDNVGVNWNWPAGLVRRALLEIGRRLVTKGRLHAPEHALGLSHEQVAPLLIDGRGPTPDELAGAWAFREEVVAAVPPIALGPDAGEPPFDVLPRPLARAAGAMMAVIGAMEGEPSAAGELSGTGVGSTAYTGRARIVSDPAEAMATLEDGDIIVASFTGPSWNSLLPMVGALVVEEGGPLCHAAIVAREFGIPALVGVTGATGLIPDRAQVEVDPVAGKVRVL